MDAASMMKKYPIPTGYLFTDQYSRGKLETLSIGWIPLVGRYL